MTLSRFALPVFAVTELQKFLASQHADKIADTNQILRTDFGSLKRDIKTEVHNIKDHFYDKSRPTREAWEAMVQILTNQFRSKVESPDSVSWHIKSSMKEFLKDNGLVDTDENEISTRVTNAFAPLKEKIELIAGHSPTMNTWYTNGLGSTYYRLLWAPLGSKIPDDPEQPENPKDCSDRQCGGSQWCRVDDQAKARELMVKAFKTEVKELPSKIENSSMAPNTIPMGASYQKIIYRVAVINRMPNREPKDLIPDVANIPRDMGIAQSAAS